MFYLYDQGKLKPLPLSADGAMEWLHFSNTKRHLNTTKIRFNYGIINH
jgi:hypothetical protein